MLTVKRCEKCSATVSGSDCNASFLNGAKFKPVPNVAAGTSSTRQAIRCDNGPELTSRHFLAWCVERQIELLHIQPSKPTQNARIENSTDGCEKNAWQ